MTSARDFYDRLRAARARQFVLDMESDFALLGFNPCFVRERTLEDAAFWVMVAHGWRQAVRKKKAEQKGVPP
jgi:hypothetical protein